jgi:cephalosporin hydroxylase
MMEKMLDLPLRDVLHRMQASIMQPSTYRGVPALKSPTDAWVYDELIHELRPDVIVEVGVNCGGGTLRLADMCRAVGHGKVVGVDISLAKVPALVRDDPSITLIEGPALDVFDEVRWHTNGANVLVIEDSAHDFFHTLRVLHLYSTLVHVGGYLICEDSICHHGLDHGPKPGPYEAIETFLQENQSFVADRSRERFLVTWNPNGYLKRVN